MAVYTIRRNKDLTGQTGPTDPFIDYSTDPLHPHSHKSGKRTDFERCHHKHPVLKLGNGELVGASCTNPREGFDVYVGFDGSMASVTHRPWVPVDPKEPVKALFRIRDMSVPESLTEFDQMTDWVIEQLNAGKRVHIGCLGGHGRTGLVLAVIVKKMLGEADAVAWVRKHHCTSAVETTEQARWLTKHYGITEAAGVKSWSSHDFHGKYEKASGKGRPSAEKLAAVGGGVLQEGYPIAAVTRKSTLLT